MILKCNGCDGAFTVCGFFLIIFFFGEWRNSIREQTTAAHFSSLSFGLLNVRGKKVKQSGIRMKSEE